MHSKRLPLSGTRCFSFSWRVAPYPGEPSRGIDSVVGLKKPIASADNRYGRQYKHMDRDREATPTVTKGQRGQIPDDRSLSVP
jgi:hypothetical protein